MLEKEPELPKLNLMKSRKDLYPEIPDTLVRTWAHTEFAEDIQKLQDQIHEEFGEAPPDPEARRRKKGSRLPLQTRERMPEVVMTAPSEPKSIVPRFCQQMNLRFSLGSFSFFD